MSPFLLLAVLPCLLLVLCGSEGLPGGRLAVVPTGDLLSFSESWVGINTPSQEVLIYCHIGFM